MTRRDIFTAVQQGLREVTIPSNYALAVYKNHAYLGRHRPRWQRMIGISLSAAGMGRMLGVLQIRRLQH